MTTVRIVCSFRRAARGVPPWLSGGLRATPDDGEHDSTCDPGEPDEVEQTGPWLSITSRISVVSA